MRMTFQSRNGIVTLVGARGERIFEHRAPIPEIGDASKLA
jgi:hypothetical protein